MPIVYLLLGSNLGQRKNNLKKARTSIEQEIGVIKTTSSLYKTAAWGNTDQKDFFNQVLKVQTRKAPKRLIQLCLEIERKLGRIRMEKWGPRRIDIDILFYGDKVIDECNLQIPHPAFEQRNFAIIPMMEIAPFHVHPISQHTIEEIYRISEDELDVFLIHE